MAGAHSLKFKAGELMLEVEVSPNGYIGSGFTMTHYTLDDPLAIGLNSLQMQEISDFIRDRLAEVSRGS